MQKKYNSFTYAIYEHKSPYRKNIIRQGLFHNQISSHICGCLSPLEGFEFEEKNDNRGPKVKDYKKFLFNFDKETNISLELLKRLTKKKIFKFKITNTMTNKKTG